MQRSPCDKRPVRAMPETTQKENHEEVHQINQETFAITTKRNIDIISEPCTQRNMPSIPEFTHGLTKVGLTEIRCEFKAHYTSDTCCNIRIAREIAINLEG